MYEEEEDGGKGTGRDFMDRFALYTRSSIRPIRTVLFGEEEEEEEESPSEEEEEEDNSSTNPGGTYDLYVK